MIYAYDEFMLSYSQELFGGMIDFAVHGLEIPLSAFYNQFLNSKYSRCIERGDSKTIMGTSGIELCYEITGRLEIDKTHMDRYVTNTISARSPEYWTGWAVAYYQWQTSLKFSEIEQIRTIEEISGMYDKYHEMDITKFTDYMNNLYKMKNKDSRLKQKRSELGLSQRQLAEMTGIPIKTIQQYEQKQKNINHAQVDYLIRISRALSCDIEVLLEKID